MKPVIWFLNGKEQYSRSSYYLEDVATEFDVQGLELDWACVTWDAIPLGPDGWQNWSFKGDRGSVSGSRNVRCIKRTPIASS